MRLMLLIVTLLALSATATVRASDAGGDWIDEMGAIPVLNNGRVMPLESYADQMAVELTTRKAWKQGKGPKGYSGRHSIELLCDLLFKSDQMGDVELITIDHRPFKRTIGLAPKKKFFSINEVIMRPELNRILDQMRADAAGVQNFQPRGDQARAWEIEKKARIIMEEHHRPLSIVPATGKLVLTDIHAADPGSPVAKAFAAVGEAYRSGGDMASAVGTLRSAIDSAGLLDAKTARAVNYELLYNHHKPWIKAAVACGLALVFIGLSSITLRRPLFILGVACAVWAFAEQALGLYLRIAILGRAPVSNTYESILWMGVVALIIAGVAQTINRKGWYLFAGSAAAMLCVLFAGLVPLRDQTNAIPAVLRSNYWLTIHVLTIVASYGVLLLAAVLGHVYLIKGVLLTKKGSPVSRNDLGHPLITQTYRTIQIGVLLLTIGTILGGVWAADSWGRFWGWDPKETWALISIVIYLIMLHSRYVGWLRDFGMAVCAVIGFVAIVWTFYGVNYVMAAGLHSYGMAGGATGSGIGLMGLVKSFFVGTGGASWVARWFVVEIIFLAICKVKHQALIRAAREHPSSADTTPDTKAAKAAPA